MNQLALRLLITVGTIFGYAAVMAVLGPQYLWLVGLLYIGSVFAITTALGIRAYRRGSLQAREIVKGKLLFEINEKDTNKALEKDREFQEEMRKLNRVFMIYFMAFPIMLIGIWLFPAFQSTIVPAVSASLEQSLGRFLATYFGYVALFAAFTAIFSPLYYFTFRPIQFPIIATDVKIYDTGIVINKNTGLKAPIHVQEYKYIPERKFIELKIGNQLYRIYYKDIEEVHKTLSKMVVVQSPPETKSK
ncbi:DUF2208 domain-containing protein [Thermoproteus tenax]|uniref:Conserved membrane protein n=1 Tax=Thermoproteus tenax (strain ATCC 35583 / DSM 2078 / JCM 9277 / NBRC 100435 / Kra 1) TaxID=768679 RepID=G4RKP1_THETK|nr:DUF2208 domain-containing protein [Thermoproteus tenax]CCC82136.1 conserved membrane protein [Thermoproteus tenax Kra 1]